MWRPPPDPLILTSPSVTCSALSCCSARVLSPGSGDSNLPSTSASAGRSSSKLAITQMREEVTPGEQTATTGPGARSQISRSRSRQKPPPCRPFFRQCCSFLLFILRVRNCLSPALARRPPSLPSPFGRRYARRNLLLTCAGRPRTRFFW